MPALDDWAANEWLSVRSKNVLINLTMVPYDAISPMLVSQYSKFELLMQPNCGKKTIEQIEGWLNVYGLKLTGRVFGGICYSCGRFVHPPKA